MKILHIEDCDCDVYGDWLNENTAKKFIAGKFTHIEDGGTIIECSIEDKDLVSIGEQIADIEDFDGFYVHYDKVIETVSRAWDEPRCYGNDPLELIGDLINERDELREKLKFAKDIMTEISIHGHRNDYDWNADPKRLTKKEGDAFNLIDKALKDT